VSAVERLDTLLAEFRRRAAADPNPRVAAYLGTHERRYRLLLAEVERSLASIDRPRILDVGHSWESEAMRRLLPGAVVDTLGFEDSRFPPGENERHVQFDLNDANDPALWPALADYDLVVAAEVLEHLYTAPEQVLAFLGSQLRPRGILILQTPNAASLFNRIALLAGRNPFERIRDTRTNPGHFREYTVGELLALGRGAGLEPLAWTARNYFEHPSPARRLLAAVPAPPKLREGITVRFRRPGS
jgi:SAM-dependent methyltransferase